MGNKKHIFTAKYVSYTGNTPFYTDITLKCTTLAINSNVKWMAIT